MQPTESPAEQVMPEPRGELIDFDSLKPLNNPDCVHEYVREADSDIPGTYTEVCRKCPVGRIVRA